MSLSVFYYCICAALFSVSVTVSPIFVSFVAISAVICGSFKAMWLVAIFP